MILENIKYDEKGLVPVIAQDAGTGEILMFAWMNRESLELTLKTGVMTYWSRSRRKLWIKGETSGNTQEVKEMFVDCDMDCILAKVEQKGMGAACHDGYRSCFYRKINPDEKTLSVIGQRIFNPEKS